MAVREGVRRVLATLGAAGLLVSCGGGGGTPAIDGASAACDTASQKEWLRSYMADWYYWAGQSPSPAPSGYATVQGYLDALRYPGDTLVPADRWSYIQDSASYSQFFSEGKTLGYGLFVNGNEGVLPLKVRYVEPASPAAAAGLKRGDTIATLNGRSAEDLLADNDFALLTPAKEGDTLNTEIADAAGTRGVALVAATYSLTPVSQATVLDLPGGRKAGYVVLKDFITQAEAPPAAAFADFRAQGAAELILDLRYNGGGRISTSALLASLVLGTSHKDQLFARLKFNAGHGGSDTDYLLPDPGATGFDRVVVLTGSRTCSASELVVNGLKPFVQVVTVGDSTCGKPFGFSPVSQCGNTYSAVNFESFNASGEGRYYNGIEATCAVADDFNGALGSPTEVLTAAATSYLRTGACPAASTAREQAASLLRKRPALRGDEPGERRGMWSD